MLLVYHIFADYFRHFSGGAMKHSSSELKVYRLHQIVTPLIGSKLSRIAASHAPLILVLTVSMCVPTYFIYVQRVR